MTDFSKTPMGQRLSTATEGGHSDAIGRVVEQLLGAIAGNQATAADALEAIKILQRDRRWDGVVDVAEAVVSRDGSANAETLRRYAQALIEGGALGASDCILSRLLDGPAADQRDEATGLQGRIAKQRYVTYGSKPQLVRAIAAYSTAYAMPESEKLWHGGNLLALLARAESDGVPVPAGTPTVANLANELMLEIAATDASFRSIWQRATEIEVLLALDRTDDAAEVALSLANSKSATPFELGSLQRQLREVWKLDADHIVSMALGAEQLSMGSGVDLVIPAAGQLEKLLGTETPIAFKRYVRGMEVARAVCMVTDRSGDPIGTGFAVRGEILHPRFGPGLVIVTNSHVVSDEPGEGALRAAQAQFRFEAIQIDGGPLVVDGDAAQLWTSPRRDLDVTVLAVPLGPEVPDTIQAADTDPDPTLAGAYVYVVGHPGGRSLALSIRGNALMAVSDERLRYRAPTEPGSSGSPVFDKEWNLVGVHHSGGFHMPRFDDPTRHEPANEGSLLRAIRAAASEGAIADA